MLRGKNLQGLDMKATINWYEKFADHLLSLLPKCVNNPIMYLEFENTYYLQISLQTINGLIGLFPKQSIARSIAMAVIGGPTTWFHKDSTSPKPLPTTESGEALSPTAIVPSYIDYKAWIESGTPQAAIKLYCIPSTCPEAVIKIILCQGFVHEFAHSIIAPANWVDGYLLKLPNGKIIDGFELLTEFVELAELSPPVSHYASTYRNEDGKFAGGPKEIMLGAGEELAETITAYLLGFSFSDSDKRALNPLDDRPKIGEWVKNFLSAEHTS